MGKVTQCVRAFTHRRLNVFATSPMLIQFFLALLVRKYQVQVRTFEPAFTSLWCATENGAMQNLRLVKTIHQTVIINIRGFEAGYCDLTQKAPSFQNGLFLLSKWTGLALAGKWLKLGDTFVPLLPVWHHLT